MRTALRALALSTTAALAVGASVGPAYAYTTPGEPRVVFVSRVGDTTQVFSMRTDGRDRKQLTSLAGPKNDPAYAPDGTVVAFMSAYRIWTVSSSGGSSTAITPEDGEVYRDPAWLPDGSLLVQRSIGYDSATGSAEDFEVFRLSRTEHGWGGPVQVTDLPGSSLFPDVTNDGRRLAFTYSSVPGAADESDIMTAWVPAAGQTINDLTATTRVSSLPGKEYSPSWSPDGTRLAFWNGSASPGAHVVDADGRNRRLLSSYASLGHLNWGSTAKTSGTILADVCAAGIVGIARIDVRTGKRTWLTKGPMDRQPSW